VKLTDFGLWFHDNWNGEWSTTIPQIFRTSISVYYDGYELAYQRTDFSLLIYKSSPYSIKLKKESRLSGAYRYHRTYSIGRLLTIDDFETIPNSDYRGDL